MNDMVRKTPAMNLSEFITTFMNDPNITADKLDAVLRMRRELLAEEQRELFHEAFAAMQAEIPQVRKDGVVELRKDGKTFGHYKFARWEDMDKVLRPILVRHGFSLRFNNVSNDGKLVVRAFLMRGGFEVFADSPPLPPDTGPGRNSLQAAGSAASYGKRYAAESVLNIVRQGEDNDGIGAEETLTKGEVNFLSDLIKKTKSDLAKFYAAMAPYTDRLDGIRRRDYNACVNALNTKLRKGTENGNQRQTG